MVDLPPSPTALPSTGTDPSSVVAAPAVQGGGQPVNATTPAPGFPDWLLQFVRGGYVTYGGSATGNPCGATDGGVRLYQLQYLFGQRQAIPGPSGVNAITFLLLVETQKLLWQALLDLLTTAASSTPMQRALASFAQPGELPPSPDPSGLYGGSPNMVGLPPSIPPVNDADNLTTFSGTSIDVCVATMLQQQVTDIPGYILKLTPLAQQTLLRDYCGVRLPVGGWHDRGYNAPHAGGNAFDIEYFGSPWIPLKGPDAVYYADVPKSDNPDTGDPVKGFPAGAARTLIYDKCMAVWNRACNFAVGHDMTAANLCQYQTKTSPQAVGDTTDAGLTTATVNAIWELSDSVRKYFAQPTSTQLTSDRTDVGPGMVIGSSSYNHDTKVISGNYARALALGKPPHSSYQGSPPQYSGGVVGFNRVVVKKIHQAKSSNTDYLLQWSVFTFGSDLMHFDIAHNPSKLTTGVFRGVPPIADVTSMQAIVEAFGTTSDGKNPWSSP